MYVCNMGRMVMMLLSLLLTLLKHCQHTCISNHESYLCDICGLDVIIVCESLFVAPIGSVQDIRYDKQINEINSSMTYSLILFQFALSTHSYYYHDKGK